MINSAVPALQQRNAPDKLLAADLVRSCCFEAITISFLVLIAQHVPPGREGGEDEQKRLQQQIKQSHRATASRSCTQQESRETRGNRCRITYSSAEATCFLRTRPLHAPGTGN